MRGLLDAELSVDVVKFGALADGPLMVASSPRFGDRIAYPYGLLDACGRDRGSTRSNVSFDIRRYACLSQSSFHVKSSFSSSRHRLETCEALASVMGSSTKEST